LFAFLFGQCPTLFLGLHSRYGHLYLTRSYPVFTNGFPENARQNVRGHVLQSSSRHRRLWRGS
jgi:hypothetical protein